MPKTSDLPKREGTPTLVRPSTPGEHIQNKDRNLLMKGMAGIRAAPTGKTIDTKRIESLANELNIVGEELEEGEEDEFEQRLRAFEMEQDVNTPQNPEDTLPHRSFFDISEGPPVPQVASVKNRRVTKRASSKQQLYLREPPGTQAVTEDHGGLATEGNSQRPHIIVRDEERPGNSLE